MISPEEISHVRRVIQEIRGHLVRKFGKDQGYFYFGDMSPGIVSEILAGMSTEEIIAKVDRIISETGLGITNENGLASDEEPDLNVSPKRKVRLTTEGKLAGGLTVPAGTICSVEKRVMHHGRAILDVIKDDTFLFEVFEDEVEYIEEYEF